MHVLAGLVAAFATAVLYASAVALQALEARKVPREHSLRPSLLTRLLRRPLWLLGTALAALGWAAQVGALLLIPLTLVEPTLAVSLVVLLGFGVRVLGERVGRREVVSVVAVTAGIGLLAWSSPARDPQHVVGARLAVSIGVLALIALVPYAVSRAGRSPGTLIAVGAGVAYAVDGLATKFFSDDFSGRAWLGLILWFAAMLGAAAVGTLSEMSALQIRPATKVAPIVLALTTLIPVALAPALAGETWSSSAWAQAGLVAAIVLIVGGATSLARSTAVGSVLEPDGSGQRMAPHRPGNDVLAQGERLGHEVIEPVAEAEGPGVAFDASTGGEPVRRRFGIDRGQGLVSELPQPGHEVATRRGLHGKGRSDMSPFQARRDGWDHLRRRLNDEGDLGPVGLHGGQRTEVQNPRDERIRSGAGEGPAREDHGRGDEGGRQPPRTTPWIRRRGACPGVEDEGRGRAPAVQLEPCSSPQDCAPERLGQLLLGAHGLSHPQSSDRLRVPAGVARRHSEGNQRLAEDQRLETRHAARRMDNDVGGRHQFAHLVGEAKNPNPGLVAEQRVEPFPHALVQPADADDTRAFECQARAHGPLELADSPAAA